MFFFLRNFISEESATVLLNSYFERKGYHGSFHINKLWDKYQNDLAGLNNYEKNVFGLSILFHDAVYSVDPKKYPLNELSSCEYFINTMRVPIQDEKITKQIVNMSAKCILATDPSTYSTLTKNSLERRFVLEYDLDHLNGTEEEILEISDMIEKEFLTSYNTDLIKPNFKNKTIEIMEDIIHYFPEIQRGAKIVIDKCKSE